MSNPQVRAGVTAFGRIDFSGRPPDTLFSFKYRKLQWDYVQAHNIFLEVNPNGDHLGLAPREDPFDRLKFAAENVLSSANGAWRELCQQVFREKGLKAKKFEAAIVELEANHPKEGALLRVAENTLMLKINRVRGHYEHTGWFTLDFALATEDAPFNWDLIGDNGSESLLILRNVRRAAHLLFELNRVLGLGAPIEPFKDACERCRPDPFLQMQLSA